MSVIVTVTAAEVEVGDFLPGLDNGYVVETASNAGGYMSVSTGYSRYTSALPESYVAITYHDANGEEAYLVLDVDARVSVKRD